MMLFWNTDVAIDIGPETSHVFVRGRGIAFSGRTEDLRASSGATSLSDMVSACLERAGIRRGWFRPAIRVVLTCRLCAGVAEKRMVEDAARSAGAKVVFLIDLPMACAIGAGLPISEPRGSMIINIRGGECELAVISLAGTVASRSLCSNVTTGAAKGAEPMLERGDPVPREMIAGAIKDILAECGAKGLKNLVSDVLDGGAVVAGDDGADESLANWLAEKAGLPVRVAHNPVTAAVEGAGVVLKELDFLAMSLRAKT